MLKVFLFVFSTFLFSPLFVFAHGEDYLEFNPDASVPLKVVEAAIPSQVFYVQNDFLGGFDLWLANSGSSGVTTFELLNEQGSVLATRTVTVPTISETDNGTKFHVDLSSQVAVFANKKYSVKVTSAMPQLKLYYSERIQLVQHNAPFVSEYITGVGKLGPEEQTFSFKYALYETTESSVPLVSNVSWTVISENQMRADFNANEPVDFRIEYGLSGQSTNWTGEYQFCVEGVMTCSLFINVIPDTTYQYVLSVKDSWGNQSQSTGTFQSGQSQSPSSTPSPTSSGPPVSTSSPQAATSPTAAPSSTTSPTSSSASLPADNTPPVISNLRIVSLTDTSVEIAWTTNEVTNSHLLISTPFFITITDASDSTMELEHLLKINSGLGANVSYVATVASIDQGSNEVQGNISFTTLPPMTPSTSSPPSPGSPNQSSQSNQVTTSSYTPGGLVQWNQSSGGGAASDGYRVDIFDQEGNLVKTVNVSASSYNTGSLGLENGDYTVIVYANKDGVFEKIDKPITLEVKSFWQGLLGFWPYFLIVLVLLGYIYWKSFKKKISQSVS